MKTLNYFAIAIVAFSSLSSCGTMASIENKDKYVQFAAITVADSLVVSGRLINYNDSLITISVDGALVEYNQKEIVSHERYLAPNPELMQQDIVKNTKVTASNTGFFVVMTIITIIAALAL